MDSKDVNEDPLDFEEHDRSQRVLNVHGRTTSQSTSQDMGNLSNIVTDQKDDPNMTPQLRATLDTVVYEGSDDEQPHNVNVVQDQESTEGAQTLLQRQLQAQERLGAEAVRALQSQTPSLTHCTYRT